MPKFPLIGPSYTSQSSNADAQSTINLYPERIESGMGNNDIVLYPSPGLELFAELLPPPPPGPPIPADIYNTITVPRSGHFSGPTFTLDPFVSGPEIKIGDTLFIAFYMLLAGNTTTIISVSLNHLGNDLGSFVQMGPTLDFGVGINRQALVIFYCKSVIDVPAAGTIQGVFTSNGTASGEDYIINWTCIHHLTTLDQVSGNTFINVSSFAAPALTIGESEFVFSYIWTQLGGLSVTIPSPFQIYTNQTGGEASGYRDPMLLSFIAAAGTYTPTWASNSGNQNAGVINASFKLEHS